MQTIPIIETPAPYALPTDAPLQLILAGAGGTGSHILQSLARLAVHVAGGPPLELVVIDGDTVEMKNVGRQLFSVADVGLNKAQALAERFSAVFGLAITAVPAMATLELLRDLIQDRARGALTILVGAVDTVTARQVLRDALASTPARLWLDTGNEEHAGQVTLGTATRAEELAGCLALGGLATALPAPSLTYPNLVTSPKPARRGDCAAATAANVQGLMVNQAVAAVAAQYLYQLVVERRITTFDTSIALRGLAMRSRPITATAIGEAAGLDPMQLTTLPGTQQPGPARRGRRRNAA